MIGLLGLLLGFTFSMAMSRHDIRRLLVVDDSNAIGTTYLRSKFLPEPHKTQVARLLRRYVDVRLEPYRAGRDEERLRKAISETQELQSELWSQAVAMVKIDPRPVPTGLFVQTLNDLIDDHEKRMTAFESQVPSSIFMLLYIAAVLSMGLTGYGCGIAGSRSLVSTMTSIVLIASVIFLISDSGPASAGTHQSQSAEPGKAAAKF